MFLLSLNKLFLIKVWFRILALLFWRDIDCYYWTKVVFICLDSSLMPFRPFRSKLGTFMPFLPIDSTRWSSWFSYIIVSFWEEKRLCVLSLLMNLSLNDWTLLTPYRSESFRFDCCDALILAWFWMRATPILHGVLIAWIVGWLSWGLSSFVINWLMICLSPMFGVINFYLSVSISTLRLFFLMLSLKLFKLLILSLASIFGGLYVVVVSCLRMWSLLFITDSSLSWLKWVVSSSISWTIMIWCLWSLGLNSSPSCPALSSLPDSDLSWL